jgi:hypothetical protein
LLRQYEDGYAERRKVDAEGLLLIGDPLRDFKFSPAPRGKVAAPRVARLLARVGEAHFA